MWPNRFIAEEPFIYINVRSYIMIIQKKRNDNSGIFRAITTDKCMSHQMAEKFAGSCLWLAFQRDGVHELYDV